MRRSRKTDPAEATAKQTLQALRELKREIVKSRQLPPPSVPVELRKRAVQESVDHIVAEPRLQQAQVSTTKHEVLVEALRSVTLEGMVAEFGVFQGQSLTRIAQFFPDQTVHGFDSFVGLPESWSGTSKGAGAFDVGGTPPDIPVDNVEFHVGFFDATVPGFATAHQGPFAFCHLDADLYSSTKTIFDELFDWFVPGTIVVFDEYFGYQGWQLHEHKAFMEFLERSQLDYEGISIGHMNLAVRLV